MPEDQLVGRDDGGAEGEQPALQPDIEARSSTQGRHQDHRRGKEKHVDPVRPGQVRQARHDRECHSDRGSKQGVGAQPDPERLGATEGRSVVWLDYNEHGQNRLPGVGARQPHHSDERRRASKHGERGGELDSGHEVDRSRSRNREVAHE